MILKKFKKEKDMTELAVQKKTLTPEQKKRLDEAPDETKNPDNDI